MPSPYAQPVPRRTPPVQRQAVRPTRPAQPRRPVGVVTRGTTNPNRLRRIDRWLTGVEAARLRAADDPLVVDLGYGASPVTAVELLSRLRTVRPDVEVVGLEIDPERVAAAGSFARPGLTFVHGGFELPLPDGRRPIIVRAANVLRQYDESQVADAWATMADQLAPRGLVIDATCDELGRRSAWLAVADSQGAQPVSLTLSIRLAALDRPSDVAERLPKALIHRNVSGEPVHAWLSALDQAWTRAAPMASYGVRQRFTAAVGAVQADGWPVIGSAARWRLGEVTVRWPAAQVVVPG
jgi:hypothetical protein